MGGILLSEWVVTFYRNIQKYKIKAIKRAIEGKQSSLEREQAKNLDWRKQAAIRDENATSEYTKRKAEVEAHMKKIEERYQKRIARTKKWWHEYADNHEANKIKRLLGDIDALQAELAKHEGGTEKPTAIPIPIQSQHEGEPKGSPSTF